MPRPSRPNSRPAPRPLDAQRLEELALAYVARFATSAAKLGQYLRRKLRERGWAGADEPPVAALVDRFVANGYVDDAAFARARTGSLLRRGYGARRIGQALDAAGIAPSDRADCLPDEAEQRRSALALARKRRFGPFGMAVPDRAQREKQLAALLRAGHRLDFARELLDFTAVDQAEAWADADDGDQ